jgi:hypothetical protein
MYEKEKIIKEQRTALAVSKKYMGKSGKFGLILNCFGKSVIYQGASNYEQNLFKDPYELEEEDKLPELDEDMPIFEIGKTFDGLKFGYHIEISYMKHGVVPEKDEFGKTVYRQAAKVLKVMYKGYYVYIEAENELVMFLPHKEWEDIIDIMYKSAEKIGKRIVKDIEEMAVEESRKEKLTFLQRLRETWGI